MEFNFTVNGDKLRLSGKNDAVAGNVNSYVCNFEFSSEFDNLDIFAVFSQGDESFTVRVEENSCLIPHEMIENVAFLQIGVLATKLNDESFKRVSTNLVGINVKTGAYTVFSVPGTPDLWETYLKEIKNDKQTVENIREEMLLIAGDSQTALNDARQMAERAEDFAKDGEAYCLGAKKSENTAINSANRAETAAQKAADEVTENIDKNIREELLKQREEIIAGVVACLPDGDEVSY